MAEGSRHAVAGVLGMRAAAACFAEVCGGLARTVLAVANYGNATLPDLTGLSPWFFIAILAAGAALAFVALGRPRRRGPPASAA